MNIIEKLIEATEAGNISWEKTSSYLSFSAHFEDKLYMVYQYKDNADISVMNENYDFVDIEEFKNTKVLKQLYSTILDKNPFFKKQVEDCLRRCMKVYPKAVKRFPKYVMDHCPDVTYSREKLENEAYYIFYNEDNKPIGAVALEYETYRISKDGLPEWQIYIGSFEIFRQWRHKGYGKLMLDWIETNLPVYKITLCHCIETDDHSPSRKFWEHMGFTKPDEDYQTMEKNIK